MVSWLNLNGFNSKTFQDNPAITGADYYKYYRVNQALFYQKLY